MSFTVKQLTDKDWLDWKNIWLEAVKLHPEAFGSSYEEETEKLDVKFRQRLVETTVFGAYDGDRLIGIAGFYTLSLSKMQHRGNLYGMYVKSTYRGQGVGDLLIAAVIIYARRHVCQLHCTVVTTNAQAIGLYERHGFKTYGTEPRALKVGDNFHDEHLMLLTLDAPENE